MNNLDAEWKQDLEKGFQNGCKFGTNTVGVLKLRKPWLCKMASGVYF